jgi:rhodanese-related sulfurtransferase
LTTCDLADENQESLADHTAANEPPPIRQLSAPELKALIESGTPFELVDVRTDEERALARINGSRLLDQTYHDALLHRNRDTPLVFQCHHGIRSQQAAEYFWRQGFRNLSNLQGGIDAWSLLVDPTVTRY